MEKLLHTVSKLILLLLCLDVFIEVDAQPVLAADEVKVLQEIAAQVGLKEETFNPNSCTAYIYSNGNVVYYDAGGRPFRVQCYCHQDVRGDCHVTGLNLEEFGLITRLPPSLAKLKFVEYIILDYNFLSGNIPKEWASMIQLKYLSLQMNNISGPFPEFIGNFANLTYLNIQNNQFSGRLPNAIGNLVKLETLILSANYLTGDLPSELSNLHQLKNFRISRNNFTGKLPNIFKDWRNLTYLEIEASGLEGPIPSSISELTNLVNLSISDLNGDQYSKFPALDHMTSLQTLTLRSCNLNGSMDFASMANLENLTAMDLSFNRLGDMNRHLPLRNIRPSLVEVYLTHNSLSGPLSQWELAKKEGYILDISYNNLDSQTAPATCVENLNLYRSFYSEETSLVAECLSGYTCSEVQYSLHINCGGNAIKFQGIEYEKDSDPGGPAKFLASLNSVRWGFSSTGRFSDLEDYNTPNMPKQISIEDYIAEDNGRNYSDIYRTARISPLSLTYYARCLANGNHTVKLHFSEIIISDNQSSIHSRGRRIFDVYIQGTKMLKDFDIAKKAKGVGKETIEEFHNIQVKNTVLEIRFHWSGKGTMLRGVYGPLISAISIINTDKRYQKHKHTKVQKFVVVGAVISVLFFATVLLIILRRKRHSGGQEASREKELSGLDLQTGFFGFKQIKAATNNFDSANKIGEGGFGSVYKGVLRDGTLIAVKQLSSRSRQGNREFVTEIGMISGLQHPNLVRLYGCCIEKNELLLVYEYMENNSLARALFGPRDDQFCLDWPTRQKICLGIARGLTFLHEESVLKVVHRDIKTPNILLDKDLNAKISDFGLAKLDEENTHISTRIAGTIGYMAPEYALWGYLTYKADVYSFGIVALEIVAGKNNIRNRPSEDYACLLDYALVLQQEGNLMKLVDPKLGSEFDQEEAIRMIKIALLCTNQAPALRPIMSMVVSMLVGRTHVHEMIRDPSIGANGLREIALTGQMNQIVQHSSNEESRSLIHSS